MKMAIRKMRQKIKPVIFVITIGFFLSMLTVIVSNVSMGLKNKHHAFKVNGEKIAITDFEREMNNVSNQYGQYFSTPLDREDAKILAVDNIISKEILKEIGHDLKVKVSSSEVKAKMSAIELQIPDKEQFKRMLSAQGFTKKTFEKSIEDSILIEKTGEKIISNVQLTEDEKKAQYEKGKYSEYLDKTYEEVLPMIEKTLKDTKGNKELIKMIEKRKKEIKIEDIRENYGKTATDLLPKVEFKEDGFEITNLDILKGALYQSYFGIKDLNEAKVKAISTIKSEIKLAKKALEKGAKKDEELPTTSQLMDLKLQLVEMLKKEIKVDDQELKEFFEKNKETYNIEASVDAKIIEFVVKPTNEDDAAAKKRAEDLLTKVTPANFSEMAKANSDGPSAPNGGDLGWFGKGQMIPEFETAAFEGKVGEVYPKVIKTEFGYHILYVENKDKEKDQVKAAHILIKVVPGVKTFEGVEETAKNKVEELKAKKLTFAEASQESYSKFKGIDYDGIKKDGYIKSLGYQDELAKAIFNSKIGEIKYVKTKNGIYIFKKTNEINFKEANLTEIKDRVIADYKNKKLVEELQKIK
jgi:peptidyl-prolyl cis-trans isomerase D